MGGCASREIGAESEDNTMSDDQFQRLIENLVSLFLL